MNDCLGSFLVLMLAAVCSEVVDGAYTLQTTPLAWTAAKAWCEGKSSTLYKQSELGQWADLNAQVALPENSSFWIGLKWSSTNQNFRWTDNSVISTQSYWSEGQPNNATGYECVLQSTVDGLWSTEQCNSQQNFVCLSNPPAALYQNTPYPRMQPKRDNNAVMWEGLAKGFACAGGMILLVAVVMHLPCCRNWVKKKENEVNEWEEHVQRVDRGRMQPVATIGQC